jgi:uncharacterized membrane protein required for colicin V production
MNPVTLPENIISIINIVLIAMMLIFALIGYLRGFVSQVYDILVMFIGYLLALLIAPPLADAVRLLPASVNFNEVPFVGAQLVSLIDTILWTIIIVIVAAIIGMIFKRTVIKKILHYKQKILVDRIGGAVFAIIPVVFVGFVLALILSTPLFSNGSTILSATVLSPLAPSTAKIVTTFIDDNPVIGLYDKINDGEELNETDYETLRQTLIDMGFPQNVIDVAMKFVKHETVTDADVQILKTYAQDNNISQETITGWLKDFGFTDAQIEALMEKYK